MKDPGLVRSVSIKTQVPLFLNRTSVSCMILTILWLNILDQVNIRYFPPMARAIFVGSLVLAVTALEARILTSEKGIQYYVPSTEIVSHYMFLTPTTRMLNVYTGAHTRS